jgi:hypothetical protein
MFVLEKNIEKANPSRKERSSMACREGQARSAVLLRSFLVRQQPSENLDGRGSRRR